MSTQLEALGIKLVDGYDAPIDAGARLHRRRQRAVARQAGRRGAARLRPPYTSGPEWLAEHVLRDKWVLAVSGTHGKTTTTSMLAWILEYAGLEPGFLIGGVPGNFGVSARLGGSKYFVVEADEYDTAFFDKRSKFVHYRPRTLVVNNIEYDHADIFTRRRRDHLAVPPAAAHGARQRAHRRERQGREHRAAAEARSLDAARDVQRERSCRALVRRIRLDRNGVALQRLRARRGAPHGPLVADRPAQPRERARGDRGGRPRRRDTRRRAASARAVQRREAPARAARHVRRSHAVRGLRASSDRDRDDAAGRAEPRAAAAHRSRHGAALEHDAHGRASRHAARLVRRRRQSVRARRQGPGLRSGRGVGAARRTAGRRLRRASAPEAAARRARGRRSRRADVERQLPGLTAAARAGLAGSTAAS